MTINGFGILLILVERIKRDISKLDDKHGFGILLILIGKDLGEI